MSRSNCIKFFRHVVEIVLCLIFLYSVVQNVTKWQGKKTVVAQGMKRSKDITYPSITMCTLYNYEFSLSKTLSTKNLAKHYESLRSQSLIKERIISISQPYNTENGCVSGHLENSFETKYNYTFTNRSRSTIFLNNSNYDLHPDILSTIIIPNIWGSLGDMEKSYGLGIQECVTYIPPGPTTPGLGSTVNPLFGMFI